MSQARRGLPRISRRSPTKAAGTKNPGARAQSLAVGHGSSLSPGRPELARRRGTGSRDWGPEAPGESAHNMFR